MERDSLVRLRLKTPSPPPFSPVSAWDCSPSSGPGEEKQRGKDRDSGDAQQGTHEAGLPVIDVVVVVVVVVVGGGGGGGGGGDAISAECCLAVEFVVKFRGHFGGASDAHAHAALRT